jgi:ABC-type transport system involved in multi-copper enzyme maturation permease subunit
VKALLADLRRTALAPATVATLLLAVLFAALFSVGSGVGLGPGAQQLAVSWEYDHGFVFRFFVFNATGRPLAGVNASVTFTTSPGGNNSTEGGSWIASGVTSEAGIAVVTIPVPDSPGIANFELSGPMGTDQLDGFGVSPLGPGVVALGPGTLTLVTGERYGLTPEMLAFDPGTGAGPPAGTTLVVDAVFGGMSEPPVEVASTPVTTNLTELEVPAASLPSSAQYLNFLLTAPNGSVVSNQVETPGALAILPYNSTVWGSELSNRAALWGFIAPVLGVGLGYSAYARPRSSRALEPVLALPTTRLGILGRRYLSAVVPLVSATGIAVLIEFGVAGPDPTGLNPALLGLIWGALALEGCAFLGVVLLLAHLLRSAAVVATIGVLLAAFLAFFVPDSIYLVELLVQGHVTGVAPWSVASANPTDLPNAGIAEYFARLGSPGLAPSWWPSAGEVFGLALALTSILTVATPLLAGWLATLRD